MRTILAAIIAGVSLIAERLLANSEGIPDSLIQVIRVIAVIAATLAAIFLRVGVAKGPGPITKKTP